ncbi:MAG TPA: DnaB-like helicase C-terminal domain-containing protein, partial [Ornithinibacter sp.]|nr:DnaB-like helicase C-terminal domain-containing protein [Ornithinibacter sp.]
MSHSPDAAAPATRSARHVDRRRSVKDLLDEADASLRRGARPGATVWPTGFDLLDATLDGGLRSGELVLLGGSEGSGKTTIALQMVRNAVRTGRHAVVFSFEHEAGTLIQRLIALEASCLAVEAGQHPAAAADVHAVRAVFEAPDPDRRGLAEALAGIPYGADALAAVLDYAPRLHIHESTSDTTPAEVARVLAEVREEADEPPMVMVDYLQKVPLDGAAGDEVARVTVVTETLKDMALELECPVVCISAADRESLGAGHRMRTRDLVGLVGPGLRGRPRAHPVEQGEHRLARAPGLRPRQRAALPALGRHHRREEPARARARRARGREGLRARALPPAGAGR